MRPALLVALVLVGCAGGALVPMPGQTWGGTGAELRVVEGGATVELDCAHGTISAPLSPGADGRFDVPGVFVLEHGGPVRQDQPPDERAARYFGRIGDDDMVLSIRADSVPEVIGPFTLAPGVRGDLRKCL